MQINGRTIHVRFVKKNVRRTFIKIANQNEVILTSFRELSPEEINEMIETHRDWIEKQFEKFKPIDLEVDEILYFGTKMKTVPTSSVKGHYEFSGGLVYVGPHGVEQIFKDGYEKIYTMFLEIGQKLGKKSDLQFRKMKTKWGVCHIDKKKIVLNKILVHVPIYLVEYIIYHEYTHFLHPNHSKAYYDALSKVCPNHKQLKKELSQYSFLL